MAQAMTSLDQTSFECSLYVGIIFTSIVYGFYLGLAFMITRAVIYNSSIVLPKRGFYLAFGGAVFLLNTLAFLCMPLMGHLMWMVHRKEISSYMYYMKNGTGPNIAWHMVVADLTQVLSMFLGDALLIYRCHVVFGSRLRVIALPAVLSVGYIGLSILRHAWPFNNRIYANFKFLEMTLMLLVNPMVTVMISWKIFTAIRYTRSMLDVKKSLTNVSAILIESAAPWTMVGIGLLVASRIGNIFWWEGIYVIWLATGLLSPQLLIFRVSIGAAWDRSTSESLYLSEISTIVFVSPLPTADLDSDPESIGFED